MRDHPEHETLLAHAGGLFHRKGFGAVSVEEVLAASRLPKAVFYRHFGTKAKLGRVWLSRLAKRMEVRHREVLEMPGDGRRRLRRYFLAMGEWMERNAFRSCPFANTAACPGDADEEMLSVIDQYKRAQLRFFIELAGAMVPENEARSAGTAVYLLYSGAVTEAQNLGATWPIEDALARAEQLCRAAETSPPVSGRGLRA